nr:hypothetical protein [Tanacetum cinerariifolium]
VGISRETSVACSPQQNSVVERRNRMLIKVSGTMLIYAKALLFLWAEVVSTASYTQNRSIIHLRYGKTPYELLHDKLPDLSFFPNFDELTAMNSKHSSLEPALHEMTPVTISSGLVPNLPPLTLYVSPSRTDWDILFLPMFDELLNPPPSVDLPAPEVIAPITKIVAPKPTASIGSPSSTTVDQDAPSPSNSQTLPETQSPVISTDVEEENYDLDVTPINNDPFFGISIPENVSEASSLDVIPTVVHIAAPNSEHELNEFQRLEVWELVPHLDKVMVITLKWIYMVKLDELGGILKNTARLVAHGYRQEEEMILKNLLLYDPVNTPMVEKSKLDEDTQWKAIDPTHYHEMAKPTEKHLHTVKRIFKYLRGTVNRGLWYRKDSSIALTAYADADHAGCQDTRRSTSGTYRLCLGFNKIPMYCDNKSAISLCCNNVQHSRSKHIDIRFYFIKEQVENGVVELYFVSTEYKLANIFTKALCRERIKFLINKLGMRSFTPKTLQQLADEAEE